MYLHVLVSAVVVGWLSGVALAASGEGLRTEFGGTYASNTPTIGQTLRSDGTGYVPQDMTAITECPLAWDTTTNQFECRDVDDAQLTETYCRQDGTNCPSGLDVDTTLFVTPTGTGTVCSISEPCGTVQQCIQTAYDEGVGVAKPMICMVAPGNYNEGGIRFTSDGTADGAPVTWLTIKGENQKFTRLRPTVGNTPTFIIERTNNVTIADINIAYSGSNNTASPIVFNDAWHGINLFGSSATMTTPSSIPAIHVRGGGSTLWTKDFEVFNLSKNEAGPLALYEFSVRPTGTPGACTSGSRPGMCQVNADCGPESTAFCSRSSGDMFIDGGVLQSQAMGTHIRGGTYCDGGSTNLTGTGAITINDNQLTGTNTSFTTEATAGNLITVNSETRAILSIESNTALTVSRDWGSTASGQTIAHTDDGKYCTADSDCDGGSGTCYTGVCENDITVPCTDANQATDCAGLGGDTCAQGNNFSLIYLNQTYQLEGTEGGICPEDLDYCASNADCNACTTNADCDTNFSDGQCNGTNCICDSIAFLAEGEFTEVTIRNETFDCLYQGGSCTPIKHNIAAIQSAEIATCGVITGATSGNGVGSGGLISSECMDLVQQTDFDPISADPTLLNEGLCWWSDAENQMKCYDGTNDVEVVMVDESGCVSGEPVVYDGSGNASCAALSLTVGSAGITGILGVGNGGTGNTSFTTNGVLYGQNLGAIAVSNAGTDNQYLASNGGVPTFQDLDATDIAAGSVGLSYGGMGEAIGGDVPGGNKDCMFFYDGDQGAGEEMRFDCEGVTNTNDYAWVFTTAEWQKLQASNNGDVLNKSGGDLVFSELTADSLNADFGDFTCTGSAGGCTIDARTGSDPGVVTGTAGTADTIAKWNADGDLVASTLLDSDACYAKPRRCVLRLMVAHIMQIQANAQRHLEAYCGNGLRLMNPS